jgi:hypothetical protein
MEKERDLSILAAKIKRKRLINRTSERLGTPIIEETEKPDNTDLATLVATNEKNSYIY